MEPALEVIHGALHGDQGALAFLERTSSIYALDVTNPTNPKTYGCWNFIHQAMNEIERYEATYINGKHERGQQNGAGLVSHARLLASISLRVARRSPTLDKKLVATCLANSEQFHGTPDQAQWLIDLNLELREIVMGRIAATAFDFSFHRRVGPNGRSSFADNVVMDTLCSILSANAVASGPLAIRQFATEWIVPSSKSLPLHAVASIILHLALEGMRKSAPAGTKDMLQQLSLTVLSVVLVPMLSDAVAEDSINQKETMTNHEAASQISSTCLQALRAWCNATELSLPQIKHICSKADISIVTILTDVMYSDSENVVDALADALDLLLIDPVKNPFTEGRMNQAQYILGVDKQSFQAEITRGQLTAIEVKEMCAIVQEIVSAVGLQRFRFTERENAGEQNVCRNLTRIASVVCLTWLATSENGPADRGLVSLLQKATANPSLNICSMALDALTAMARNSRLTTHFLLSALQRRAIIPHLFETGTLSLKATDSCGVALEEFLSFRANCLSEALIACCAADSHKYIDSCTSAVEEFCTETQFVDTSLQLEAALYCLEVVANDLEVSSYHHDHFLRLLRALQTNSPSLLSNPITLSQMCRVLRKFSQMYIALDKIPFVMELVMKAFSQTSQTTGPCHAASSELQISLVSETVLTFKEYLCIKPTFFGDEQSLRKLREIWVVLCSPELNKGKVTAADRAPFCVGICCVVTTLANEQQLLVYGELISKPIDLIEHTMQNAQGATSDSEASRILADAILTFTKLLRAYADTGASTSKCDMTSGCNTSPDNHALISDAVLELVQRGWPLVAAAAEQWAHDEQVAHAVAKLVSDLLPSNCNTQSSRALIQHLFTIARAMLGLQKERPQFDPLFSFLKRFVHSYGEGIEKATSATLRGFSVSDPDRELCQMFESLLLATVAKARESFGQTWFQPTDTTPGKDISHSSSSLQSYNEALVGLFSFLQECVESCPHFLISLPVDSTKEGSYSLLHQAIEVVVGTLYNSDPEVGRHAMRLLTAVVNIASRKEPIRSLLSHSPEIAVTVVNNILQGCCGPLERSSIADAANLLHAVLLLSPEWAAESPVAAALNQEHFKLGHPGILATVQVLQRSVRRKLNNGELTAFLENLWDLHQIEDLDALPNSDAALLFIQLYSS